MKLLKLYGSIFPHFFLSSPILRLQDFGFYKGLDDNDFPTNIKQARLDKIPSINNGIYMYQALSNCKLKLLKNLEAQELD